MGVRSFFGEFGSSTCCLRGYGLVFRGGDYYRSCYLRARQDAQLGLVRFSSGFWIGVEVELRANANEAFDGILDCLHAGFDRIRLVCDIVRRAADVVLGVISWHRP